MSQHHSVGRQGYFRYSVSKNDRGYWHLRECANRVVSLDTTSVFVVHRNTVVAVGHVRDDRIEQES